MPTLAQSVLPFDCSLCGVEVTSTEAKPHLGRRQCGRCHKRARYAASVGKSVDELHSRKPNGHPDSIKNRASAGLVQRECEHCSAPFASTRSRMRFCSKACADEARKQRQRVIHLCRLCGEPRDSRKIYCSRCLSDPQIYRACPRCGVVFNCAYVSQDRAVLVRKYCSRECRSQASSDVLSGRGKPPNAECERCGAPFTKGKQASKRFCSYRCGKAAKAGWIKRVPMACAWCDKPIVRQIRPDCPRSFCDAACRMAYAVCVTRGKSSQPWSPPRPKPQPLPDSPRPRFAYGTCPQCGESFMQDLRVTTTTLYCSSKCGDKAGRDRRRARKRDAYVADVWRPRIYKRDGYRCQICGGKLAMGKSVPHPKAPTIDHIIPLAEGGTHEPANCQAAHFMCNATKSSGTAPRGDQLLLIG